MRLDGLMCHAAPLSLSRGVSTQDTARAAPAGRSARHKQAELHVVETDTNRNKRSRVRLVGFGEPVE